MVKIKIDLEKMRLSKLIRLSIPAEIRKLNKKRNNLSKAITLFKTLPQNEYTPIFNKNIENILLRKPAIDDIYHNMLNLFILRK